MTDARDSLHWLCRCIKESAGMLSYNNGQTCRELMPKKSLWRGGRLQRPVEAMAGSERAL